MLIWSLVLLLIAVYVPSWWVKFTMRRYARSVPDMQGTGGELALHLVERFELAGVTVRQGEANQNHYDPSKKEVVLAPNIYGEKSITAVAVAAHEVGHAIQFVREEPVSKLRERYLGKAFAIKRIGEGLIAFTPVVGFLVKSPVLMIGFIVIGLLTLLGSVAMYFAILPEEYDASFRKALPILEEGYLPESDIPKARAVLKAAAYTYVAAAFADIVSIWRWFRMLR